MGRFQRPIIIALQDGLDPWEPTRPKNNERINGYYR